MPYSSFVFDNAIAEAIRLVKPKTFLDVGAGAGKYGAMVKRISPGAKTIAIELEKDYIEKFNLRSVYSDVWTMSATDIIQPKYFDEVFDVVMLGDVLEHLKKSCGIDLINFFVYRCRWMVIEFPDRYLQNSVDGYAAEAHISAWSESDFESFERTKMIAKDTQRLIVIRGYHENSITTKEMEAVFKGYE